MKKPRLLYKIKQYGVSFRRNDRERSNVKNHVTLVKPSTIWHHLYNLKDVKKTHGGVLLLVNLWVEACNFTKSNALPWVFFTAFH